MNGRMTRRIHALAWLAVAAAANLVPVVRASSSTPGSSSISKPIVVRVRLPDGSMERVAVDSLDQPLCDVLRGFCPADTDNDPSTEGAGPMEVRVGQGTAQDPLLPLDDPRSLAELSVRHGSLLTLVRKQLESGGSTGARSGTKRPRTTTTLLSSKQHSKQRWDPFPDLAKDYRAALAQYEKKKRSRTTTSYSDLSDLQAQMHAVEPQPDGPLRRVYLCRTCAERFNLLARQKSKEQKSTTTKSKTATTSKTVEAAMLFGIIARERVDPKHRPKTSLSSTTEAQEYCHAAHVHAMWMTPSALLDEDSASSANGVLPKQVSDVAAWLGLRAVGWMFAYQGEREEGVPVHAADVLAGAQLQIHNMKKLQGVNSDDVNGSAPDHPSAFVTLAMDAESGATEAFQLSDVAVQIVAEGILSPAPKSKDGRLLSSRHPVAVDGKETNEIDSLLCLVNTALLSREGSYAGPPASGGKVVSQVKKAGGLTTKARMALASALVTADDEQELMRLLSDMALLVALHDLMGPDDCRAICTAVRKWTRLKRGASLDGKLKERLRRLVEGA